MTKDVVDYEADNGLSSVVAILLLYFKVITMHHLLFIRAAYKENTEAIKSLPHQR